MAKRKASKKKATTRKPAKKTTAKKKAVKKTAARKPARKTAKKSARKSVKKSARKVKKSASAKKAKAVKKSPLGKIKEPFTKSELLNTLVERTGLTRKEVSGVMEEFVEIMGAHLKKGSAEKFVLSGAFKATVKRTPAKKARKGINPFTGEETTFKAKPAGRKVKIVPLKALKDYAS